MNDYKLVTVPKPWGKEYLVLEENNIAGWILHINKGERTSLHCHPTKKTSLVILKGKVVVNFLTSSKEYSKGEKIIIRQGVFHSTVALTDSILLETETPVNKADLIRLKDSYGRENKPYESNIRDRTEEELFLDRNVKSKISVGDSALLELKNLKSAISEKDTNDIFIFISGGIFSNSITVAGPGDALSMNSFDILNKEFNAKQDSEILHIKFI